MFKRILSSVRGGRLWASALKLSSEDRYQESLEKILSMEETVSHFPCEFELFKGSLLSATGDHLAAIDTLSNARSRLDKMSDFTSEEREYLKCYAEVFINYALKRSGRTAIKPFDIDFGKVSLDKVASHWKTTHPLRDHPEWVE